MNWPNRLSILRVMLIPVCLFFLCIDEPVFQGLTVAVFIVAAATDLLDGYLARRNDTVTNFGKFLDPVADKLLVLSLMIGLSGLERFPAWACVVILFRELAVDGLRLVAVEQRCVIAASPLGKLKTILQMTTLGVYLLKNKPFGSFPMDVILMVLSVVVTIWSGADYFARNHHVLKNTEAQAKP